MAFFCEYQEELETGLKSLTRLHLVGDPAWTTQSAEKEMFT